MHRRTALSVSAALLAAAPLLAACSGQARPGTAAVVGGERITTSALQAQVGDVRDAQNRTGQSAAQLIANTPGLERHKLDEMLRRRIVDKTAKTAGITATEKEIEDVRKAYVDDSNGAAQFEAKLLGAALTPGQQADAYLREQVLMTKLKSTYGSAELVERLRAAAKALHIEVNPRYGAWDAEQLRLGTGQTPWITQRTQPEQAPAGA